MNNKKQFGSGAKAGIPIALGYFAVAFSLGIKASAAGMSWYVGFISSILNHASAGEYAVIQTVSDNAGYLSMAIVTLVANCRYLLMSTALSQRISPNEKLGHKLLMGFGITDEIFAVGISQNGDINHNFVYGAMVTAIPAWATGTALGIIAGNILPKAVVTALSVAIYGMFLAIIIPPAKKNRAILILIILSFVLSFGLSELKRFVNLSDNTIIIALTILVSAIGAILFPVKDDEEGGSEE